MTGPQTIHPTKITTNQLRCTKERYGSLIGFFSAECQFEEFGFTVVLGPVTNIEYNTRENLRANIPLSILCDSLFFLFHTLGRRVYFTSTR